MCTFVANSKGKYMNDKKLGCRFVIELPHSLPSHIATRFLSVRSARSTERAYMAEALLEVVLNNLNSLIQREIGLIWGFEEQMERLASTLSTISAVMEDAESKQLQDKAVNNWLRKLKRAAYEVDDVLDECATEATRLELKLPASHLLTCYSTLDNVVFRFKIGNKMKEIEKELDEIAEERHKFHLQEVHQVGVARSRQTTFSILTQPQVYGRGEDLEYVVEQLVQHASESQDLTVLPVVGMGGLGKTTLAQLAFNDDRVIRHFELSIWVCVSDEDFDLKKIIKAIMESVCNEACEEMHLDPLLKRLREKLSGKRYFLVLDDVWKVNQQNWEDLRGVLNCGSRGASVIVTTRLQTVASIMGTLPPRSLSALSENECWKLFKQRAFGAEREESAQLVAIGKEIVKKCGGVPLAAKTLGSLMRFKTTEQEWQMVKESEIWMLPQDADSSILPALRLSYVNLPVELRQCFAYCSVFPKDSEMQKENVIQLWMANGYIRPIENVDLEDIGAEIWRDLYWRSFFQEVKNDKFGDIYSFKMHDLIHDLATSIMDDQCKHPAGTLLKRNYLRTLTVVKFSAKNFISLRVFSGRWRSKLSNLIHLRYLDLSNNSMRTLPNSIGNLLNLQILNLNNSQRLRKLPRGITRLRSLRHLYMDGCNKMRQMPAGIGQLKNLKTLNLFIFDGRRGCGLDELEPLKLGGQLAIKHLERVGESRGAVNLAGKQNIRELELHWKPESVSESELQGNVEKQQQLCLLEALQPHSNLKSLVIDGYGGSSFPAWMSNQIFQNLHSIRIEGWHNCRHLPGFGQLPFLERLEISRMRNLRHLDDDDDDDDFHGGVGEVATFPSLKSLKIQLLPCLEKLCKEEGRADVFPCLSELFISYCPKLSLPCLSSLNELRVWYECDNVLLTSISNLSHITLLSLMGNKEDVCFPEGMLRNLTALQSLEVVNFRKLKMLPTQLENLSALKSLAIRWCDELESLNLPSQGLNSLQDLRLAHCPKLKSMAEAEALQHLTALQSLSIESLSVLKSLPDGLGMLTALRSLVICNCPEMVSLPDSIQSLVSLRELRLGAVPNLKSLPDGLGKLTSLESLEILYCPEVASLPESIKGLTNLRTLEIRECHQQLRRRYHKERGEEYHKIAHIQNVFIY